MIEVVVVGEGQTEETFIRDVLRPAFWGLNLLLQPRLIRTSRIGRGGALTRDRVIRFLRNTLRERDDTYVTTLFDLYGLKEDFPGARECADVADAIDRAMGIEERFGDVVVKEADCRVDRFLPHIQPHEFESLLFADIARVTDVEPAWNGGVAELIRARTMAKSPEHINDGATTHPSARLLTALEGPKYQKVLHGPVIAEHVGLDRMRAECLHFAGWLERLERLAPL